MNKEIKQTLFVNGVLHDENQRVLLVQRSLKDKFLPGYFELPGGRVNLGETIEHALKRKLEGEIGITLDGMLYFTSLAQVDRNGPYTRLIFEVNHRKSDNFKLSVAHDNHIWVDQQGLSGEKIASDSRAVLEKYLGEASQGIVVDYNTTYVIFTDGGSRGNPGPSASAYVVYDQHDNILETGGEYIGITTNNQAEYNAVLLALQSVAQIAKPIDSVILNIDSLLVVNQMNGIYKIKNRDLWPVHQKIREQMRRFASVRFNHIPREQNKAADSKVNEILDAHKSS